MRRRLVWIQGGVPIPDVVYTIEFTLGGVASLFSAFDTPTHRLTLTVAATQIDVDAMAQSSRIVSSKTSVINEAKTSVTVEGPLQLGQPYYFRTLAIQQPPIYDDFNLDYSWELTQLGLAPNNTVSDYIYATIRLIRTAAGAGDATGYSFNSGFITNTRNYGAIGSLAGSGTITAPAIPTP